MKASKAVRLDSATNSSHALAPTPRSRPPSHKSWPVLWERATALTSQINSEHSPIIKAVPLRVACVRPLSLFYSDESADGMEERSFVPRSRSHARLRQNATMNQAFSCVQPVFIDL
ncbi:hypothetical protein EVAR_48845_1 [Eumeta japonica]|uniref:Uncharacterized protein n=1 Tax=Eumeta variegata TaxID=151549 RepID=A0A4C1Y993_EUMVA|nr:hypothetical protein EVAR_48845_1 [Eumeta japonica]